MAHNNIQRRFKICQYAHARTKRDRHRRAVDKFLYVYRSCVYFCASQSANYLVNFVFQFYLLSVYLPEGPKDGP